MKNIYEKSVHDFGYREQKLRCCMNCLYQEDYLCMQSDLITDEISWNGICSRWEKIIKYDEE
jgi:hypothetical protein